MVKDVGVTDMKVPGFNAGKLLFFFPDCAPFLPHGNCSIRVSQSCDFLGFAL